MRLARPRDADVAALSATLHWHGRAVARARWHPRDPRGRLLWTDDAARAAFTALAAELATHAVPTCRRPLRDEAANQLMIWLTGQAAAD